MASEELQPLSAALSAALTPGDVLDVAADLATPLLGADSVYLALFDDDEQIFRLVASRRSPLWVQREFATFSVDAPLPAGDVVRTGRPVLLASRAERDARYPTLKDVAVDKAAWAVLPMNDQGRLLGLMSLGWREEQQFTPEQLDQCTRVVKLCAAALARAMSFAEEQQARAQAEQVAKRLREMQTLTKQLAQATDPATVADLVVGAGVRALEAEAATIGLYDGHDTVTILATSGLPPDRVSRWATFDLARYRVARDAITTRAPVVLSSFAERSVRYPELDQDGSSLAAWITAPLVVQDRVIGLAAFGWTPARSFSPDDVDFASAITSHAAIALDRSQLLAATRQVAATMQRALLPKIVDSVAGWDIGSCYEPAVAGTEVGGDWFDAFALPDGRIGLVVGDVAGKGIHAATVMGSVRSATRAFAVTDPRPAQVMGQLDLYFAAFKPGELVTCWYAVLDPATGELVYASAGQLAPLVTGRARDRWLDAATTPPLGVAPITGRHQAQTTIGPGEVLLLYSDGLIERRDQDLETCMKDLARAAVTLPGSRDLRSAVRALIQAVDHPSRTIDDIAILALRRHPAASTRLQADTADTADDEATGEAVS